MSPSVSKGEIYTIRPARMLQNRLSQPDPYPSTPKLAELYRSLRMLQTFDISSNISTNTLPLPLLNIQKEIDKYRTAKHPRLSIVMRRVVYTYINIPSYPPFVFSLTEGAFHFHRGDSSRFTAARAEVAAFGAGRFVRRRKFLRSAARGCIKGAIWARQTEIPV